jgi:hypothetical protein
MTQIRYEFVATGQAEVLRAIDTVERRSQRAAATASALLSTYAIAPP